MTVFTGDDDFSRVVRTVATPAFAVVVGGGWIEAGAAVAGIAARSAFFFCFRCFCFFGGAGPTSFPLPCFALPGFPFLPDFQADPPALRLAAGLRPSAPHGRLTLCFRQLPSDLRAFPPLGAVVFAASHTDQ